MIVANHVAEAGGSLSFPFMRPSKKRQERQNCLVFIFCMFGLWVAVMLARRVWFSLLYRKTRLREGCRTAWKRYAGVVIGWVCGGCGGVVCLRACKELITWGSIHIICISLRMCGRVAEKRMRDSGDEGKADDSRRSTSLYEDKEISAIAVKNYNSKRLEDYNPSTFFPIPIIHIP